MNRREMLLATLGIPAVVFSGCCPESKCSINKNLRVEIPEADFTRHAEISVTGFIWGEMLKEMSLELDRNLLIRGSDTELLSTGLIEN